MKLREVMSNTVVRIHPNESVSVAARMLEHYNIGMLPVCGSDGRVCGLITDRDIVTRCLAAERSPKTTAVREVMTAKCHCCQAGYGRCFGGKSYGQSPDPAVAGHGKRKALRNGIAGGSGKERRDKHRRRRCAVGDQQPSIQQRIDLSIKYGQRAI